ncbi:disease resistance-like protein DSC2 [Eucalyptus grandis]|uniref:disease resistance-like protein DSC2 n=1 Tax=Eucalyptus grandis TaxID=71139 RepID=UPI00192E8FA8|nr:disease resistance-like protein DSC2 [Eucalyptus grandis]
MAALASLPSGSAAVGLARINQSEKRKAVCRNSRGLEMHWQALTIRSPLVVRSNYDVFLNFRGEDTRDGFTDHLYNKLVDAKFSVFKDDSDLLAKRIVLGIFEAIKNSKIAIPIISKNYGDSKWCLNELHQIMDCRRQQGQVVLPIFYDVDVSDVREQRGEFGKGFRKLAKHHSPEQVEKWKEALRSVTRIKGCSLREDADGRQGQLEEMVFKTVSSILRRPWIERIPMFRKYSLTALASLQFPHRECM